MRGHQTNEETRPDEERPERPIRRLADRRLDFAGPVPHRKSYIVASTDRCGSTFLCSLLWQTGVLGAPTEYWNYRRSAESPARRRPKATSVGNQMIDRLGATSATDYLAKLLACRTSPNGVFGVKAHSLDFEEALRQFPTMLDLLAPVTFIYIRREDKIAQAVSMAKAAQTGAWVSLAKPKTANLHYDRDLIAKCLSYVERQDRDWARWFETHKITPFVVTYENLTANTAAVVRGIVELMGVQSDPAPEVRLPAFEKQGDETNEKWVTRFRRESRAAVSRHRAGTRASGRGVAAKSSLEPELDPHGRSHVFDRYDEIKDAAARPIEAKRLRHRYEAIIAQNRDLFRTASVLEIYSGEGRWTSALLDAGANRVVSLESDQSAVEAGKNALERLGVEVASHEFVCSDIIAVLRTFDPESFDVVLCQDFSKLADPHLFFQRMRRLRPRHIILDTGLVGGKVPIASFRLKQRDKVKANASAQAAVLRVVPNHELIRILCDYFDFRWRTVDWSSLGIGDWTGIHDYERGRRRTYVLERIV
jgi:trehalose 2-sulfotransferase